MEAVYKSSNKLDVEERKLFLESAGISCEVFDGGMRSAFGELLSVDVELVLLNEEDTEQAIQLLAQFDQDLEVSGPEWACPTCGERIEPQFTECWKCGRPRP